MLSSSFHLAAVLTALNVSLSTLIFGDVPDPREAELLKETISTGVNGILDGEAADASGWHLSPWFGWYAPSVTYADWVYSLEWDGYVYVAPGSADLIHLWAGQPGSWYLTQSGLYPWAWSYANGTWEEAVSRQPSGEWTFLPAVAEGIQFDVDAGPNDTIHLVSRNYHQFDRDGNEILTTSNGDAGQQELNFPPGIAVDDDGYVHMVTRSALSFTDQRLRYRKLAPDGSLEKAYFYGTISRRNYVVSVATPQSSPPILLHTTAYDNVWGDIFLYGAEDGEAPALGSVTDIWRADNDARLEHFGDRLYLVAGLNDPDGKATITWGQVGPDLEAQLAANKQAHKGGEGRRGFPDIAIDDAGVAHLIYGSYLTLQYNRYDSQGVRVSPNEKQLFGELGQWHLNAGLGAVGVSPDGAKVLAVALETDGSKEANVCEILWTSSTDGGETWSEPEKTGARTSGGEGRLRPRVVTIGDTFYLFYYDLETEAISLGILKL